MRRRLSKSERLEVVELVKNGTSLREVARQIKTSYSTIQRLIKKHEATGSTDDRPKSGRPRILPVSESSWFECVGQKRPFVCTECGKTFKGLPGLKNHMKIHEDDRQYQCDQCGRGFINSSSLVRHIRTHTGEKPYICEYCARSFADIGTMRTHIRTHTGERPHKCHLCEHACRSAGNLHAHMKVHRDKNGKIPQPINVQLPISKAVPIYDGFEMLRKAKRNFEKFSNGCSAADTSESETEAEKLSCKKFSSTKTESDSTVQEKFICKKTDKSKIKEDSNSNGSSSFIEVKKEIIEDDVSEAFEKKGNIFIDERSLGEKDGNCLLENDIKKEPL